MDAEEFEVYPISHRGMVYNIITPFDMTFREVRGLLDWLSERNAFGDSAESDFMGPGNLYSCPVEGFLFEVDVQGFEVVVYRRIPA